MRQKCIVNYNYYSICHLILGLPFPVVIWLVTDEGAYYAPSLFADPSTNLCSNTAFCLLKILQLSILTLRLLFQIKCVAGLGHKTYDGLDDRILYSMIS